MFKELNQEMLTDDKCIHVGSESNILKDKW